MANERRLSPITVEGGKIIFRNFSGAEGQYNREGDRNFCLVLERDLALQLEADGWNVKWPKPREVGDEPLPYLPVAVSYKNRPPTIVMVTSRGKTPLTEDMLFALDWANIVAVDITVNPYQWQAAGKTGVKAYLRAGYFIIEEDYLERKYADVPVIGAAEVPLALEAAPMWEAEVVEEI